jgi:hypothetical protein
MYRNIKRKKYKYMQDVPGGKVSILWGHSIGHSKKEKGVYVHVSYSERFPR